MYAIRIKGTNFFAQKAGADFYGFSENDGTTWKNKPRIDKSSHYGPWSEKLRVFLNISELDWYGSDDGTIAPTVVSTEILEVVEVKLK